MTLVRAKSALLSLAAGCGLLIAVAPGAAAAPDPTGHISDVHQSTGRVQFVFSAENLGPTDKLNPASVQVSAGGQTLPATASAPSQTTGATRLNDREVILALDTSGSMKGDGIVAARVAAAEYATAVPTDVKLGLLTFSDKARLLVAPTTRRSVIQQAIQGVTAGGDTALYDGVVTAVQAMAKARAGTELRLVILSDGEDTKSRHSITDAIGALNRSGVAADVVAFRLPGDRTALNQLASSSHGRVLPAANAADLANAFAVAATAFQQQVLVTVQVPPALAGKDVSLSVSMNAGAQSVSATRALTLPVASAAVTGGAASAAAVGPVSHTTLWLVLGIAFVGLLGIALLALWAPAAGRQRTAHKDRIAEVTRYRVIESLGRPEDQPAQAPSESNLTKATLSFVDRAVRARGKRQTIVDELERAGLRIRPEEWAVLQIAAGAVVGALCAVLFKSVIGLLIGALLGWLGCRIFIRGKISRRAARFEEQLPDMLQLVAGSLRSGFSLNQSIAGVVNEGTEPTASEFARALTEVRLGADLEDALDGVAERMKCLDLHLVVMAVRISREVGGNLAEVLLTTVATMRERAQLRGQVKVLSAEGRLSAKILMGLPFGMAAYLLAFKPGYLDRLVTTGMGLGLIALGVTLLVLGSVWISRLVKIEV